MATNRLLQTPFLYPSTHLAFTVLWPLEADAGTYSQTSKETISANSFRRAASTRSAGIDSPLSAQ